MKELSKRQIVIWSIIMTTFFELITVIMRFGCKLESTRDTASTIGVLTMGVRIHHGYIGALAVLIAMFLRKTKPAVSHWTIVFGNALIFSDLIHHFLVLWPIVGSPEFDFHY